MRDERSTKSQSASSGSSKAYSPAVWVSRARRAPARRLSAVTRRVWSTDKDGIIPCLLSAEITARLGKDPGEVYRELTRELGDPLYERIEAPATPAQKSILAKLSPSDVQVTEVAGEKIEQILTKAPGDGNAIGGIKVIAKNGWFAARPSGTEEIYKIYAESFLGQDHLRRIEEEAQSIVSNALAQSSSAAAAS